MTEPNPTDVSQLRIAGRVPEIWPLGGDWEGLYCVRDKADPLYKLIRDTGRWELGVEPDYVLDDWTWPSARDAYAAVHRIAGERAGASYPASNAVGPTGRARCPSCGNSSQNESPDGSPELLRCASCKLVFQNHLFVTPAQPADNRGVVSTSFRERMLFDAGFRACRAMGDNAFHYRGEQADRIYAKCFEEIPPAPSDALRERVAALERENKRLQLLKTPLGNLSQDQQARAWEAVVKALSEAGMYEANIEWDGTGMDRAVKFIRHIQADNQRMREVIKPFAAFGEAIQKRIDDGGRLIERNDHVAVGYAWQDMHQDFHVSHFLEARSALETQPQE